MLPALRRSLYQKNLRSHTNATRLIVNTIRSLYARSQLHTRLCVQVKADSEKLGYLKLQKCDFRTTQCLHIPPLVALFLRPILSISSLLLGRGIKRWWGRKSDKEKEEYKRWYRENSHIFFGCFAVYGFIIFIYYISHLKTDPLTQRMKFVLFNQEQEKKLGQFTLQVYLDSYKKNIVPKAHPAYMRSQKIIKKIVAGNRDLKPLEETEWTLTVIDVPLKDSFILPGGHIFITLDILKIAENDDQLGIILAHEIAHSLLSHSLEILSNQILYDLLMIMPILLIWAIFPDIAAIIIHMITERVLSVMYNLPYSRSLETEADEVGIKLAAKACIDVREAVVFWATMRMLAEMELLSSQETWVSTHPSHKDREKNLNNAMTKALELRNNSGCSILPATDPRVKFYQRSSREQEIYFKQKGII